MKFHYSNLGLLLISAIVKASYITDITIITCPTNINGNGNVLSLCTNLQGNTVPDFNWDIIKIDLNQYDPYQKELDM